MSPTPPPSHPNRHSHLAVVVAVEREQVLLRVGMVRAERRQQAAGAVAAARRPDGGRLPAPAAAARVPHGARRARRKIQHARHRLRHGAHQALAEAR